MDMLNPRNLRNVWCMAPTEHPRMKSKMKSTQPFPETLLSLMEMQEISRRGLAKRCQQRDGWGTHSSISDMLHGKLRPSVSAIESIAGALGVSPETFAEYRLAQARARLDPEQVGLERALKNLAAFG